MAKIKVYDISVVGSAGFLGSAIVRIASSEGSRVAEFGRSRPVMTDGVLDSDAASSRHLVWAAGSLSPLLAHERPDLVEDELDEFRRVLDAVSAASPDQHVVLLGSGGTAYDIQDPAPHSETSPVGPSSAYGRYKVAEEDVLRASGLSHTVLRVANAYGPGQKGARGQGVLAFWMRAILQGESIKLLGSGDVARDYVYVDDVARAVTAVAGTEAAPALLNVGSGVPTSLDELLSVLRSVVGNSHPFDVEHLPARGVDVPSTWLNVSEAARTIGWEARTPLEDGVRLMWNWLVE